MSEKNQQQDELPAYLKDDFRVTCHSYTFLQQPSFYLSIVMLNESFYICPSYSFILENKHICHIVVLLHNQRLTLLCIF